jgi:hypothetical protein
VILRAQPPWRAPAAAVLLLNFAIPFVVLLPKAAKKNPKVLFTVALLAALGLWLERFLLVAPSLISRGGSLGWTGAVITIGFAAGFAVVLFRVAAAEPPAGPRH